MYLDIIDTSNLNSSGIGFPMSTFPEELERPVFLAPIDRHLDTDQ